jgi:hypothetical protein
MDVALVLLGAIDWSSFESHVGSAVGVGDALRQLLDAPDAGAAREAWWGLENVVFSQDDVFSAAEPTIDVLLAALAGRPPAHVKSLVLDLLFHLLHGESVDDPTLSERCRAKACRGTWLLVAEAASREGPGRETVVEILEMVDPSVAALFS